MNVKINYGKDYNLWVETHRPTKKSRKLERIYKGWKNEEEDVSSSWITLKKIDHTGNGGNREHSIALCGEIAVEETMDQS
jgi:hypothetical protein